MYFVEITLIGLSSVGALDGLEQVIQTNEGTYSKPNFATSDLLSRAKGTNSLFN